MATKVKWNPSTEPDLDHYNVYLDSNQIATVPAGTEEHIMAPGVEGQVTITAVDQSGNESAHSTPVFFDNVPPAPPAGLSIA